MIRGSRFLCEAMSRRPGRSYTFSPRDDATVTYHPQKHRRNRRNRRASSRGGVSTTDRSEICLLFLLKLVCTFWTAALHLRQ